MTFTAVGFHSTLPDSMRERSRRSSSSFTKRSMLRLTMPRISWWRRRLAALIFEQKIEIPGDGCERRAELVRHQGHELALQLVDLPDTAVLLLQRLVVSTEVFLEALLHLMLFQGRRHLVEGCRQLIQFPRSMRQLGPCAQIT